LKNKTNNKQPEPHFQKMGFNSNDFPEAEKYYKEAISLPIYPGMSDKQQNFITP
jgi:dTDP-4-amino-4,6-dideoxygalactose transaminase